MPRNGSGVYSLPEAPFVPNTNISSSAMNDDLSDIGTALTGSLPTDGSKGMDGGAQLALDAGTLAAPGLSFSAEPGLGLRRSAAHTAAISSQNVDILAVSAAALTLAAGAQVLAGTVSLGPMVGEIRLYAGPTAPTAWLFCSGQSLLRATYPDLFVLIGVIYGSVDGTHFSLPNFNGRAPAGVDYGSGVLPGLALGTAVGEPTHTLITSELPTTTPAGILGNESVQHVHVVDSPNKNGTVAGASAGGTSGNVWYGSGSGNSGVENQPHNHILTGTPFGADGAHNNVQPTLGINFMIFTGVA